MNNKIKIAFPKTLVQIITVFKDLFTQILITCPFIFVCYTF